MYYNYANMIYMSMSISQLIINRIDDKNKNYSKSQICIIKSDKNINIYINSNQQILIFYNNESDKTFKMQSFNQSGSNPQV